MTNTSIKHPLLRSQIYIWEGYWTGWQLRVCNLDKGNLTIFRFVIALSVSCNID
eukprot:Pgem_evm3s496